MKKPIFINNGIYHVYNRGVEKRNVFMNDADHFRFIHDLFEFNDTETALNLHSKAKSLQMHEVQPRAFEHKRKLLVEIFAFCLMPNHFHLLLRQKRGNGISTFMQKLGTGYTMYFNQKYERVGALFQGRFKAMEVEREEHLLYLPFYIHLNPVELIEPRWKERNIKDWKQAIKFLESYRWSSYLDYIGKKNFPSVSSREFLAGMLGKPEEYKKAIQEWLKNMGLEIIRDVIIE